MPGLYDWQGKIRGVANADKCNTLRIVAGPEKDRGKSGLIMAWAVKDDQMYYLLSLSRTQKQIVLADHCKIIYFAGESQDQSPSNKPHAGASSPSGPHLKQPVERMAAAAGGSSVPSKGSMVSNIHSSNIVSVGSPVEDGRSTRSRSDLNAAAASGGSSVRIDEPQTGCVVGNKRGVVLLGGTSPWGPPSKQPVAQRKGDKSKDQSPSDKSQTGSSSPSGPPLKEPVAQANGDKSQPANSQNGAGSCSVALNAFQNLDNYLEYLNKIDIRSIFIQISARRQAAYDRVRQCHQTNRCSDCMGVVSYCQFRGFGCEKSTLACRQLAQEALPSQFGHLVLGMLSMNQWVAGNYESDCHIALDHFKYCDTALGLYLQGRCLLVQGKPSEAHAVFVKASASGHGYSFEELAKLYKVGRGCVPSPSSTAECERQAALYRVDMLRHYYFDWVEDGRSTRSRVDRNAAVAGGSSLNQPDAIATVAGGESQLSAVSLVAEATTAPTLMRSGLRSRSTPSGAGSSSNPGAGDKSQLSVDASSDVSRVRTRKNNNASTKAAIAQDSVPTNPIPMKTKTHSRHIVCEHGRRRTVCPSCTKAGQGSLCIHRKQRAHCRICRELKLKQKPGSLKSYCQHKRQKSRCKLCSGSGICEHGRERYRCTPCLARKQGPTQ
jgi:hypothetical protein